MNPCYPCHPSTFRINYAQNKFVEVRKVENSQHVYHVSLNRPEHRNAISSLMWQELGNTFKSLGRESDCRAIVLSATGKAFCSGIDIVEAATIGSIVSDERDIAAKGKDLFYLISALQETVSEIENCNKPVISAIHGGCIGAGLDLISATDIRYCTIDAWFQVKDVASGLAADMGTLQRLPKIIGSQSTIRELCYTARKLSAEEADKIGLVSKRFPDRNSMIEGAIQVARFIAEKSPIDVQSTRIILNYSRDHSVSDSLNFNARWNQYALQSQDVKKAFMALASNIPNPADAGKLKQYQ